MTFVSYAQNFEDVLLWRALQHVTPGRYLDIGAQDPIHDSVSLAFYNAGWRGIHVEPTPAYASRLREARPDENVIEAAVSQALGPIELYEFPDTGLSTGKADIAVRHVKHGFPSRTILIPTVRLDRLLEQAGELHWLKIDVEGMEADVLASWGEHPARPWVVVIEATAPLQQDKTDKFWRHELLRRDYLDVHFDGLSHFFVHKSQRRVAKAFASPPNVFDCFQITDRHFSGALVHSEAKAAREKLAEVTEAKSAAEHRIAELGATAEAAQADRVAALEATAASERHHRVALERFEGERREFRDRIEATGREMLAAMEQLATFRERSAQLASQVSRLSEQLHESEERRRQEVSTLRETLEARIEEMRAKAAGHEGRLAEADGLIRKALAAPSSRWHRVGRALHLASEDQARQALRSWSGRAAQSALQPTDPVMHFAPPRETRNPYLRADSLAELTSWDDVDFVRCAYVTILGRQPDAQGEHHFTNRLRMGDSKYTILWQLRRSDEGPNHDPGIAGLDRSLKREALRRNRLFGWMIRAVVPGEGVSKHDRHFRQLQNRLAVVAEQQSRQTDVIIAIKTQGSELAGRLEQIAGNLERLAAHDVPSGREGGDQSIDRSEARSGPSARVTDDLDLSSRERAVLLAIQSAKY